MNSKWNKNSKLSQSEIALSQCQTELEYLYKNQKKINKPKKKQKQNNLLFQDIGSKFSWPLVHLNSLLTVWGHPPLKQLLSIIIIIKKKNTLHRGDSFPPEVTVLNWEPGRRVSNVTDSHQKDWYLYLVKTHLLKVLYSKIDSRQQVVLQVCF